MAVLEKIDGGPTGVFARPGMHKATVVVKKVRLLATGIVALALWVRAPLPAPKVLSYTPLTHDRELKGERLVTDGTRLYFTIPKKIGWTIAEVSASGGETAPIPSHLDDVLLVDISPNGSELLIGQHSPVEVPFILCHRLPGYRDVLGHSRPRCQLVPNGEQIVMRGNELYVAKPDGKDSRRS
jgi:hypothetical protein